MKTTGRQRESLQVMSVLLILAAFIMGAVVMVVVGANTYDKMKQSLDQVFNERTIAAYIGNKVRQNDVKDGVEVRNYQETDVLVLSEFTDTACYETWIYVYDGKLMELYIESGADVTLTDGFVLLDAAELEIELREEQITFRLTTKENKVISWVLARRSKGGSLNA